MDDNCRVLGYYTEVGKGDEQMWITKFFSPTIVLRKQEMSTQSIQSNSNFCEIHVQSKARETEKRKGKKGTSERESKSITQQPPNPEPIPLLVSAATGITTSRTQRISCGRNRL